MVTFASLPPHLIVYVIQLLPIPCIASIACVSRRLKILAYSDAVYARKLVLLGLKVDEIALDNDMDKIASQMKQLPGGHLLTSDTGYFINGSYWSNTPLQQPNENEKSRQQVVRANQNERELHGILKTGEKLKIETGTCFRLENSSDSPPNPPITNNIVIQSIPANNIATNNIATNKIPNNTIAQTQDGMQKLIVGAGGLNQRKNKPLFKGGSSDSQVISTLQMTKRKVLRRIVSSLREYYFDFKTKQKDSKLFKDYQDIQVLGSMLNKLKLLHKASLFEQTSVIEFNLSSAIECFSAAVLGQFERAYDEMDVESMKNAALALYNLDGGSACVQLCIAKNSVFYNDPSNYSPMSLSFTEKQSASAIVKEISDMKSDLKSNSESNSKSNSESNSESNSKSNPRVRSASQKGVINAHDFEEYIVNIRNVCQEQCKLSSLVFLPQMNAMTLFASKIFEDSVLECLNIVLARSKSSDTIEGFLDTFAIVLMNVEKLIEFLQENHTNTDSIKQSVVRLVELYTEKYIQWELDTMKSKFNLELSKWNAEVRFFEGFLIISLEIT